MLLRVTKKEVSLESPGVYFGFDIFFLQEIEPRAPRRVSVGLRDGGGVTKWVSGDGSSAREPEKECAFV